MSQRSNTIKAAGLYTFLSELQAPEGSLVKADNINIDEMGVITPRRGFGDYGEELPNTSQTVKQLLEYKNRILRHYNGKLEFDDGNGVFTPFLETIEEVEPGLRIKSKQVNSNLYFTSSEGIKKLSAKTSADLSNINIDNAGVPKAVDLTAKVSPASTALGFLPPRSKVGYKILYGYRDLNNVLILGAPTSITVVTNAERDIPTPEQFSITFQEGTSAEQDFISTEGIGKYFTISTLDIDYYVWYNIADIGDSETATERPEDEDTFGKIPIQVNVNKTDTNEKIAAKTANVLNNELSSQFEVIFLGNKITLKSKEDGNIKNATNGNLTANEILLEIILEGNLIEGKNVNCEIETVIPNTIDKDRLPFFIQIYRTRFITATEDQELSDILPGEECNLVHEEAITLEPGQIYTHIDDVTEDFRDRGTPLYNNPFSGEGLLQTNEIPPIAKDIENFNNYTFYSNTKTFHRSQFRFISVDDFKNEETAIFIGNEDILNQYVFRGVQEQTTITCGTKANTAESVIEENQLVFKNPNLNYLKDTAEFQVAVDNGIVSSSSASLAIFENYLADAPSLNTLNFYEIVNNQLILKNNNIEIFNEEIKSISIYQNYLATLSLRGDPPNTDGVLRLYEIIKDPVTEDIILNGAGFSTFDSNVLSNNSVLSIFNDTVVHTNEDGDNIFIHKIQNNTINPTPDLIIDNQTITDLKISSLSLYQDLLLVGGEKTLLIDISDLQNIVIKNEINTEMQESFVSIQGSYALVSNVLSSGSNDSFTNAGEVKVYKINTNNQLNLLTTLYSPIEIDSGSFGRSVDVYNNYIIIGQRKRTLPSGEGNSFLFRINNDDSIELIDVQSSSDETQTTSFGEMVRLYDDKIAVGTTGPVGAPGTHLFQIKNSEYLPIESTQQNPAYLKIYSREDENKYYLWYNLGQGVDPSTLDNTLEDFTGIEVNITENDNFTEILESTKESLEVFSDFQINTVNLLESFLAKQSTNIFNKENHGLVTNTKVIYKDKNCNAIPIDNNNFKLYDIDSSSEIKVGSILTEVLQNPLDHRLEKDNHGLQNGNSVTYNNIDYIVTKATENHFKLLEDDGQEVEIPGIVLENVTVTSNEFASNGHGLLNNDFVRLIGTVDDPSKDGEYFVINTMTDTFQLSITEGGPAETFTDTSNLTLYSLEEIDIQVNDNSSTIEITTPFRLNVKNSNAGQSTGIENVDQTEVEVVNVSQGLSSYINLYSAEDTIHYYIWFNKGNSIDPLVNQAIGIEVDISSELIADSENVSVYLRQALLDNLDFFVTLTNPSGGVIVTNSENGESTNSSTFENIETDIGNGWAITTDIEGIGEDTSTQSCKWSINPSIAISIEETARSFVRVVNRDVDSPVNAFYLSGEEDIPGLILLENRNVEDKPFYVGVRNTGNIGKDISTEFDPALPFAEGKLGTEITVGDIVKLLGEDIIRVSFEKHGLNVGDEIYFYLGPIDEQSNVDQIKQTFTVIEKIEEGIDPNNNFYLEFSQIIDTTNSPSFYFYKTDQASENEVKPNRLYYSKLLQPEAVPIGNFLDVGSRDFPIERIIALRDTLFVLKTDGIYMLTGFGAPFAVRILDNTSKIIAPDSAVVLNNQIYCLTDDGVASITESGISIISRPIEDRLLEVTGQDFDFRLSTFAVPYDNDKAYILWLPVSSEDTVSKQAYRYNYYERTWTRWTVSATSGVVSNDSILYLGDGERPYTLKERKSRSRLDFSDINFTLQIPPDSVIGETTIRLSNFSKVEVGDVLVQEQYVTIDVYNNLLLKLDLDPLVIPDENEKYEAIKAAPGDNISTKLDQLEQKLISDGINISDRTWIPSAQDLETSTFAEYIRDEFNAFIDELNNENSGTQYKTYSKANQLIQYESIVDSKNTKRPDLNRISVLMPHRFFEGDIEIYKAIKAEIQWNPLHFGDPSAQKQFSKGTVIVDQNNFTKATVSYSSDVSQGFVDIEKQGKGVGYFSSGNYGDSNLYWGGDGNDVPLLNIIPREKQRGRYLNVKFQHAVAREGFRVLGVTTVVRAVSDRGYR
jgi:hypothetical protein